MRKVKNVFETAETNKRQERERKIESVSKKRRKPPVNVSLRKVAPLDQ